MKILIAEDSVVSRRLLEATLRKWGYEVQSACDGLEAWDLLQKPNPPSLVILDWVMPGLTGLEVCRKIRQQNREPYTYILLLTSRTAREDVVEGMEAGADDYVTKPFDQSELQVRLRAGRRILDLQEELVKAREALREQATRDALTKLWNRSAIMEILDRELARVQRENSPLSIAMLDFDKFKSINDSYGHIVGDAVLRRSAEHLKAVMRGYDALGRYGGEELMAVLPGCGLDCAMSQAERMRAVIEINPIEYSEGKLSVTASFGVATVHPGEKIEAEALIKRADEALYQAKSQGRNRVVSYECPAPQLAEARSSSVALPRYSRH